MKFHSDGSLLTFRLPGTRDARDNRKRCPDCEGQGGNTPDWREQEHVKPCERCKGEGTTCDAVRGDIGGFSKRSRMRMLQLVSSLRADALPIFCTLTYPLLWPSEHEAWKRHLDTFGKWLLRAYPAASAVWKLEPQKRGAPHFHLLIYGVPFIPHQLVAQRWFEIVGSGDTNHRAAGTRIESIRSRNGVLAYASKKYMGKECEAFEGVGRFWGVFGRKNLPRSTVDRVGTSEGVAVRFVRTVRRYLERRGSRCNFRNGSLFTANPKKWRSYLRTLEAAPISERFRKIVADASAKHATVAGYDEHNNGPGRREGQKTQGAKQTGSSRAQGSALGPWSAGDPH